MVLIVSEEEETQAVVAPGAGSDDRRRGPIPQVQLLVGVEAEQGEASPVAHVLLGLQLPRLGEEGGNDEEKGDGHAPDQGPLPVGQGPLSPEQPGVPQDGDDLLELGVAGDINAANALAEELVADPDHPQSEGEEEQEQGPLQERDGVKGGLEDSDPPLGRYPFIQEPAPDGAQAGEEPLEAEQVGQEEGQDDRPPGPSVLHQGQDAVAQVDEAEGDDQQDGQHQKGIEEEQGQHQQEAQAEGDDPPAPGEVLGGEEGGGGEDGQAELAQVDDLVQPAPEVDQRGQTATDGQDGLVGAQVLQPDPGEGGWRRLGGRFCRAQEALLGHVGPGQVHLGQVGPAEVSPPEVGAAQVGPLEVGVVQVGPAEVAPLQDGPAEVSAPQVRPAEVGPVEVGPGQDGPVQVNAVEVRLGQILAGEVQSLRAAVLLDPFQHLLSIEAHARFLSPQPIMDA